MSSINVSKEDVMPYEEWYRTHLTIARYVARTKNIVLGFVALSPTSSRDCYQGVSEASIYIGQYNRHKGVEESLLRKAIDASEQNVIYAKYRSFLLCIKHADYGIIWYIS